MGLTMISKYFKGISTHIGHELISNLVINHKLSQLDSKY